MQLFFIYIFWCLLLTCLLVYECNLCTTNDVIIDMLNLYIILAIVMISIYF